MKTNRFWKKGARPGVGGLRVRVGTRFARVPPAPGILTGFVPGVLAPPVRGFGPYL